ncbi:DUF7282 domain-containing protein [Halorussus marinus]|uniref:DUF7282 domain-containing protein n=1 Tax=Halorussus marinus TaxID=2505976 RepID=UPI00106EDEF1|nr:hypothetical protein [Halorussus marinus]
MIRKTALVALVALLAVGMSMGAMGAAPMAQDTTEEGQETTTEGEEMDGEETTAAGEEMAENATVTLTNQTTDGSELVVNETMLPEGGFIAIHLADNVTASSYEDPENVSVGPVVGNSTYLEAGTHENVTVELNRSINESQPLVAMPHQDTNDDERYTFPEADDPYTVEMLPVIDVGFLTVEDGGMAEDGEEMTTEEGEEMTTEEGDAMGDGETTTEA